MSKAKKRREAEALTNSASAVAEAEPEEVESESANAVKKSETRERLIKRYKTEPNAVIRQVDHYYARVVTERDDMTWEEFCDLKIKAFTEFWTEKKNNPEAGKTLRTLTPEQILKKEKELEKMEKKMAAYKAQIAKSKSA